MPALAARFGYTPDQVRGLLLHDALALLGYMNEEEAQHGH